MRKAEQIPKRSWCHFIFLNPVDFLRLCVGDPAVTDTSPAAKHWYDVDHSQIIFGSILAGSACIMERKRRETTKNLEVVSCRGHNVRADTRTDNLHHRMELHHRVK